VSERLEVRVVKRLPDFTLDVAWSAGAGVAVLFGPSGAGKTLTLQCLAGLLRPDAGRIVVDGRVLFDSSSAVDVRPQARRVGYVGPEAGIYPWMTPREVLDLAGRIAEYEPSEIQRRIDRVAEAYQIGVYLDQPIRRGGEPLAQRVGLASAMLTDPEVLLLDEPLRAIDAEERARLLTIPGRRRTVVIASRYPASESGIAKQLAFLSDGRLRVHAPIAELDKLGLALSQRGIDAFIDLAEAEAGAG